MFIKKLKDLNKNSSEIAGGKGASLGEMINANILVPNGFVILSDAFQRFIETNDLNVQIEAILEKVNCNNINTINNASLNIQELILNTCFPTDLENDVLKEFEDLDCEFVAVRSSATTEDGKDHAWAGQLNSYLNTTNENLLLNVKNCFASLFTPRAIFYRFEKELHKIKISVAVVVQKMIQSEVSGIAFSVHPITEDHNQILIEAGYGLGEAIVSGQITPDAYTIHKNNLEIIDKNIGLQTRGIFKGKTGDEWLEIEKEKQSLQKLTDTQIIELTKLIIQIENHYSFPCDIEWGLENYMFYILQSRPITTLSNEPLANEYKRENSINEKDYGFLWRVYTWFPFTYLLWESGYQKGDFIFTYEYGEYFAFVSKKEREKLSKRTLKIYTKYGCEKYYLKSKKISDNVKEEFEKLAKIDLTKLNNNKLASKFLKMRSEALKLLKVYLLLEYHSMDLVAKKVLKEDTEIKSNAQFLGEFKLEMRAVWGSLLEDGGLLPKLLEETSKRLMIGKKADLFTIQELCSGLKGLKGDFSLNRNEGYVWGKKIGTPKIGIEATEIIKELWKVDGKIETLTGQIAQKGFYKGKVKKIDYGDYDGEGYLTRKIEAMEKGDVLVVGSTSPEFMIACKKAGAIITDEGGVISHAAIISRELKIPCIIGTKYATHALNDGDIVEVDANNGIVNIYKK